MDINIYIYMYIYIYTYVYIYIYTHNYVYIYIYNCLSAAECVGGHQMDREKKTTNGRPWQDSSP